MELINKKDALHAVLHNSGQAAVAAVENIEAVNETLRDKLILNICSHCDSHIAGCDGCPIIADINEVFNNV